MEIALPYSDIEGKSYKFSFDTFSFGTICTVVIYVLIPGDSILLSLFDFSHDNYHMVNSCGFLEDFLYRGDLSKSSSARISLTVTINLQTSTSQQIIILRSPCG